MTECSLKSAVCQALEVFGQFLTSSLLLVGKKVLILKNYKKTHLAQKMLNCCHDVVFLI
jgi:hypothetical protein